MDPVTKEPTSRRSWLSGLVPAAALLCLVFFFGITFKREYKERLLDFGAADSGRKSTACQNRCELSGSEPLPKGIISRSSNLEMRPLWGSPQQKRKTKALKSLLAMAVGIKQKETVDQIVRKFPSDEYTFMLFHYDGVVDEWRSLSWADTAVHVSAINQTKWWFAKRFLHPDIVSEYRYIFLWDEDLDVQYFNPGRYLSIIQEEGLEISQPALDLAKSEVHHRITVRRVKSKVHRRMYKIRGGGRCYENSTAPPCTGWVEMMAPVFSRAAWRCTWHMIQNDLIHAWGLDIKLGYCSQGDRTKNVGVVDAEYIIHKGLPTLGGVDDKHTNLATAEALSHPLHLQNITDARVQVRIRSSEELDIFNRRWQKAVEEDRCWVDPFPNTTNKKTT